ncbi:carbohydrate kinase family protein [Candidatus Uhrbacteria bacterium]|nr:carbohydrate kinase family protein [Candidatus Uhrbacteria bacterium]
MTFDIVTIGSSTQDVFLIQKDVQIVSSKKFATGRGECFALGAKVELDSVVFDTGGGATNAAVTLRRSGFKTGIVSRAGNDPAGQEVLRVLKHERVDCRYLHIDHEHGTAYSSILLTPEGERTVLVYRGASHHFVWDDFPIHQLKTKWLYVTSLAGNREFFRHLVDWATFYNVKVMWNPGVGELEWGWEAIESFDSGVHILMVNREEAAQLTKKLPDNIQGIYNTLHRSRFGVILVTDGKHGAFAWAEQGGRYVVEARSAEKPINTTGAGDAFGSAFLAGYIKFKGDIPVSLRLASYNSGLVIMEMGPKHGIMKRMPGLNTLKRIKIIKE